MSPPPCARWWEYVPWYVERNKSVPNEKQKKEEAIVDRKRSKLTHFSRDEMAIVNRFMHCRNLNRSGISGILQPQVSVMCCVMYVVYCCVWRCAPARKVYCFDVVGQLGGDGAIAGTFFLYVFVFSSLVWTGTNGAYFRINVTGTARVGGQLKTKPDRVGFSHCVARSVAMFAAAVVVVSSCRRVHTIVVRCRFLCVLFVWVCCAAHKRACAGKSGWTLAGLRLARTSHNVYKKGRDAEQHARITCSRARQLWLGAQTLAKYISKLGFEMYYKENTKQTIKGNATRDVDVGIYRVCNLLLF